MKSDRKPKNKGRLDLIGNYRRWLKDLAVIEDERKWLKRGVELLTDILRVAEDLHVLDYDIKNVLGLKTVPD